MSPVAAAGELPPRTSLKPTVRMPISGVAMNTYQLPAAGTIVEMTVSSEPVNGVRVVQANGPLLTLSMALAAVPDQGSTVTLRWPAGERGRYALTGTVVAIDDTRVNVEPAGQPDIEQQRSFVRGGGGEEVLLYLPGRPDIHGYVRNISERGVRAHFTDVVLAEGDTFRLRVALPPDTVELAATAVKVESMRQKVPEDGPISVELVAVFTSDNEAQAKVIRRYILRQQLLARGRSVGG
jgi:hypothetical protein